MPAHSASKTRVNALMSRASTSFSSFDSKQDVDGRASPAMTWRARQSLQQLVLLLDLAHLGIHGHVLAAALGKAHAGLEIVAAGRALRRLLHFLRPFAERIAEPRRLWLELGQPELLPDHLGALHVFALRERDWREVLLQRCVD